MGIEHSREALSDAHPVVENPPAVQVPSGRISLRHIVNQTGTRGTRMSVWLKYDVRSYVEYAAAW